MEEKGIKQVKALKVLKQTEQKLAIEGAIPEDQLNEQKSNRKNLKNGKNSKK